MLKLNLGCGNIKKEGWINCDFVKTVATDKIFDLTRFPYPFEDNSVSEIEFTEVLEHLPDSIAIIREMHRILAPGGKLHITVPYCTSVHAWSNPEHRRAFNYQSFKYFRTGSNEEKMHNFGFSFKEVKIKFRYGGGINPFNYIFPPIVNLIPDAVDKTQLKFLFNPDGLDVELIK